MLFHFQQIGLPFSTPGIICENRQESTCFSFTEHIFLESHGVFLSLIAMHTLPVPGEDSNYTDRKDHHNARGGSSDILSTASCDQSDQEEPQCGQTLDVIMIYLPREGKEQDQLQ